MKCMNVTDGCMYIFVMNVELMNENLKKKKIFKKVYKNDVMLCLLIY